MRNMFLKPNGRPLTNAELCRGLYQVGKKMQAEGNQFAPSENTMNFLDLANQDKSDAYILLDMKNALIMD